LTDVQHTKLAGTLLHKLPQPKLAPAGTLPRHTGTPSRLAQKLFGAKLSCRALHSVRTLPPAALQHYQLHCGSSTTRRSHLAMGTYDANEMSRKIPNTVMGWSEHCWARPSPVVHSNTRPITTPSCSNSRHSSNTGNSWQTAEHEASVPKGSGGQYYSAEQRPPGCRLAVHSNHSRSCRASWPCQCCQGSSGWPRKSRLAKNHIRLGRHPIMMIAKVSDTVLLARIYD
jgi:hypothetical protein